MKKLANIIIKFSLPAIILILSPALVADERASSDKCYLFLIEYINDKNEVKEFLADKTYSLDRYSVFSRKDGQYYFTLGKMKKKLFEELKLSGQTDGLSCTRGKGFQKRFNINEELKLVSGTKKFIDSVDDFYKATGYVNVDTNIVQQSKENSSNSSSAIDPNLLKLKKQIDSVTNEIRKASKMSSGFQQMHPDYRDSFSFDFIALKNKKFRGLIQNLDGTISINDSVQPKALVVFDSRKHESDVDLFNFQKRISREKDGKIASLRIILESLFDIGIYQESFDSLQSNLINHLESVVEQDSIYADSDMQYQYWNDPDSVGMQLNPYDSGSCFAKKWVDRSKTSGDSKYEEFGALDLASYAFILAPKSCMHKRNDTSDNNFNEATYTLRNFPGLEPITINSNLASINYFEFISNIMENGVK